MSDFLSILTPLLTARTATIQLTINKHAEGHLSVVAMPVVVSDKDDDDDVKKLVAALSVPVKFTGTIESIATELKVRVDTYVPRRTSWEQQLDAIDAQIKTSTDKAVVKTDKKTAPKPASKNRAADVEADAGHDDDDEREGERVEIKESDSNATSAEGGDTQPFQL